MIRSARRSAIRTAVGACVALAAMLGSAGAAEKATLSGPSTVKLYQSAKLTGRNYPPNAAVVVRVMDAQGREHVMGLTVGRDGSLSVDMTASVEGLYTLTVVDGQGQALATARIVAGR